MPPLDPYPIEEIPIEDLDRFGRTDKSIVVWWSPFNGGWVHAIAITAEIPDGGGRDQLLSYISHRQSLGHVWKILVGMTRGRREDPIVREVIRTWSVPASSHPGVDVLDVLRDDIAADLGWTS